MLHAPCTLRSFVRWVNFFREDTKSQFLKPDPRDPRSLAFPFIVRLSSKIFQVSTSMRSFPTIIFPPKFCLGPSAHISSVTEGSSAGTKCVRTRVFTPASFATFPTSIWVVWEATICSRSLSALGTRARSLASEGL